MDNILHVSYRLSEPVLGIIYTMGYFTHNTPFYVTQYVLQYRI